MKVGNRPQTRTRHAFTLSAEQLMEEAGRKEMGRRIRELRERSPWRQHHMADKLHIGLRMYQRLEERGSSDWERVEKIGEIHGVDPHWIWSGEARPETPDLMRRPSQLDRIEDMLRRLLTAAGLDPDEIGEGIVQAAEEVALESAPDDPSQSETGRRDNSEAPSRGAVS